MCMSVYMITHIYLNAYLNMRCHAMLCCAASIACTCQGIDFHSDDGNSHNIDSSNNDNGSNNNSTAAAHHAIALCMYVWGPIDSMGIVVGSIAVHAELIEFIAASSGNLVGSNRIGFTSRWMVIESVGRVWFYMFLVIVYDCVSVIAMAIADDVCVCVRMCVCL